jgi:hypothetical protein
MTITSSEQEFVNLSIVIVEKNKIEVCSEHTTYVNELMPVKIDINAMIKDFKKTCTKARKVGVRISHKNGSKDYILNKIEEYEQEYQECLLNFNSAYELSKKIFVENKLPVGTRENKDLRQIYSHVHNITRLNYRSGMIHIVSSFERNVARLKKIIKEREEARVNGEETSSITLVF